MLDVRELVETAKQWLDSWDDLKKERDEAVNQRQLAYQKLSDGTKILATMAKDYQPNQLPWLRSEELEQVLLDRVFWKRMMDWYGHVEVPNYLKLLERALALLENSDARLQGDYYEVITKIKEALDASKASL